MNGTDQQEATGRSEGHVHADETEHIAVRGLCKSFGKNTVFDEFDVFIRRGKITSIFGPNGCGKSTLLNLIAGLMDRDAGSIDFSGGGQKAETAYVFQNYREALFPWLTVYDNIAYPLQIAGYSKAEQRARIDELYELFGATFNLRSFPYVLSGGQQQLTAVMRSLATRPDVLFLDEPFSALDYEMTLSLRDKLQEVHQATGVTMVLVSHDLEEAVYLSDDIILLSKPPTAVAATLEFCAARPRGPSTASSTPFIQVKAEALEIFQREVRR